MKAKILRLIILICTVAISLFSILLIMGLVFGVIEPPWLAFIVGGNALILLFNAVLLGVIGTDKAWWKTKDELEKSIEISKRFIEAYNQATEDMKRHQLSYHYKIKKLND